MSSMAVIIGGHLSVAFHMANNNQGQLDSSLHTVQGQIQRLKKGGATYRVRIGAARVWDAVVFVRALAAFPGHRAFVAS